MAYDQPFGGSRSKSKTFTQLTAPGTTAVEDVAGMKNHYFTVNLLLVDTNVAFSFEGTIDGTNFFDLETDTAAITGYTSADNVHTATVNGRYPFLFKNRALKQVRFNFSAEVGGTAATLDVDYFGSN